MLWYACEVRRRKNAAVHSLPIRVSSVYSLQRVEVRSLRKAFRGTRDSHPETDLARSRLRRLKKLLASRTYSAMVSTVPHPDGHEPKGIRVRSFTFQIAGMMDILPSCVQRKLATNSDRPGLSWENNPPLRPFFSSIQSPDPDKALSRSTNEWLRCVATLCRSRFRGRAIRWNFRSQHERPAIRDRSRWTCDSVALGLAAHWPNRSGFDPPALETICLRISDNRSILRALAELSLRQTISFPARCLARGLNHRAGLFVYERYVRGLFAK